MIPDCVIPTLKRSIKELLDDLISTPGVAPMRKVIPFPRYPLSVPGSGPKEPVPSTAAHWTLASAGESTGKTHPMTTLNATPGPFPDEVASSNLQVSLGRTSRSIPPCAGVIDVGGYSSQPHAEQVGTAEGICRTVPITTAV